MKKAFSFAIFILMACWYTAFSQDTLFQVTGNNDHPIMQVLNEGDGGSIRLLPLPGIPPQPTNKLSNAAGILYFGDQLLAPWSLNGSTLYYNGGNVGIGLDDPEVGLGVLRHMAVGGLSVNGVESGRFTFDEDLNQAGTCGFEFWNNGLTNQLELLTGCNLPDFGDTAMIVRRSTARVSFPNRVRIGDQDSPGADLHIKCSDSPFPDPTTGGIILEQESNGNKWQTWNSSPYMSFAYNGTRVAYINTIGDFVTTSDSRMKEDIGALDHVLDKVMKLTPVTYRYKHQSDTPEKSMGFIAQDVMPVFPSVVNTEDGQQYGLSYKDFSVIAIKAIQELSDMLDQKDSELESLRTQISDQQEAMSTIQTEQQYMKAELEQIKESLEE